jgi:hypothetical protein
MADNRQLSTNSYQLTTECCIQIATDAQNPQQRILRTCQRGEPERLGKPDPPLTEEALVMFPHPFLPRPLHKGAQNYGGSFERLCCSRSRLSPIEDSPWGTLGWTHSRSRVSPTLGWKNASFGETRLRGRSGEENVAGTEVDTGPASAAGLHNFRVQLGMAGDHLLDIETAQNQLFCRSAKPADQRRVVEDAVGVAGAVGAARAAANWN